jgi:hypothetical protein
MKKRRVTGAVIKVWKKIAMAVTAPMNNHKFINEKVKGKEIN